MVSLRQLQQLVCFIGAAVLNSYRVTRKYAFTLNKIGAKKKRKEQGDYNNHIISVQAPKHKMSNTQTWADEHKNQSSNGNT